MNEKTIGFIGTLGCILFGAIASLVAWFCGGKDLQTNTKEVVRQMFNFEITLFIVGILLNLIPILGQLTLFVLWLYSIVLSIKAYQAINNNTAFKAPSFELIK